MARAVFARCAAWLGERNVAAPGAAGGDDGTMAMVVMADGFPMRCARDWLASECALFPLHANSARDSYHRGEDLLRAFPPLSRGQSRDARHTLAQTQTVMAGTPNPNHDVSTEIRR